MSAEKPKSLKKAAKPAQKPSSVEAEVQFLKYLDGALNAEETKDFEAQLIKDPGLRDSAAELLLMDTMLRELAKESKPPRPSKRTR